VTMSDGLEQAAENVHPLECTDSRWFVRGQMVPQCHSATVPLQERSCCVPAPLTLCSIITNKIAITMDQNFKPLKKFMFCFVGIVTGIRTGFSGFRIPERTKVRTGSGPTQSPFHLIACL